MIFSAFLIDLNCRCYSLVYPTWKKHQTLAFLLMVEFLRIFKKTHFWIFWEDFLKASEAHAKMVECNLFYLKMVAQTQ